MASECRVEAGMWRRPSSEGKATETVPLLLAAGAESINHEAADRRQRAAAHPRAGCGATQRLQLRLGWFSVCQGTLMAAGWFLYGYLVLVALPVVSASLLVLAVWWHREGTLHERLFPGAFETHRESGGAEHWKVAGAPPDQPAYIDSPRVILAVLGCVTLGALLPPLQLLLVYLGTGENAYEYSNHYGQNIPSSMQGNFQIDFIRDIDYRYLFATNAALVLILVVATVTLPPAPLFAALRKDLDDLTEESRKLRLTALQSGVRTPTSASSNFRVCIIASVTLSVALIFEQVGPCFCRHSPTAPLTWIEQGCKRTTLSPRCQPEWVVGTVFGSFAVWLAMASGLLAWFSYARPKQVLGICCRRVDSLTAQLDEGLEEVPDQTTDKWDYYNRFLKAWQDAQRITTIHDNQLILREVSGGLAGSLLLLIGMLILYTTDCFSYATAIVFLKSSQNTVTLCSGGGVSVGHPLFELLLLIFTWANVYSLLEQVSLLRLGTERQIELLDRFQTRAIDSVSEELATTVKRAKVDLQKAMRAGESIPSILGLALTRKVSTTIKSLLVITLTFAFAYLGVALYFIITFNY